MECKTKSRKTISSENFFIGRVEEKKENLPLCQFLILITLFMRFKRTVRLEIKVYLIHWNVLRKFHNNGTCEKCSAIPNTQHTGSLWQTCHHLLMVYKSPSPSTSKALSSNPGQANYQSHEQVLKLNQKVKQQQQQQKTHYQSSRHIVHLCSNTCIYYRHTLAYYKPGRSLFLTLLMPD